VAKTKLPFNTEEQFVGILKKNIRPAQPIDTPELLQGRSATLKDIGRTLNSPGMHVFVHGERGIGKTSIALTAAKSFCKSDPPYVGCDERATFDGVVRAICATLLNQPYLRRHDELTGTAGINVGLFKAEAKVGGSGEFVLPEVIASVNQAANLVRESAANRGTGEQIIIVDELDRVASSEVKSQFAEMIKLMHDMRAAVRLVMCGIGKTLDEIIGSHLSASRAITSFELPPISYDARWAIVTNAAQKLGFEVDRDFLIRISQISDGFPYYVHLIAENLFWEVFDHRCDSVQASSDDFHRAISRAIERAESPLRDAYNFAIQKTKNSLDYEEALWAMAESTHLERQLKDIYEKSYLPIMDQRKAKGREALTVDKFRERLYKLCDDRHGKIIVRKRNSWYAYNENVLRGYVRLMAERNGIPLGADHF
jgi:uncharacterized protein